MKRINDRIGAILGSDPQEKIVKFLGFGTYIGDKVPVEAVGFLAEMVCEMNHKNPCLQLDNGTVVYGCECWWGAEDNVKRKLEQYKTAGYTIVQTNIDEVRQVYDKRRTQTHTISSLGERSL